MSNTGVRRRKGSQSRKVIPFHHWQINFRRQAFKLLEEKFGSPSEESGKYHVELDVTRSDVLNKNRWINAAKDAAKHFVIPDDIGNFKDASFFDRGEIDFNFLWYVFVPIMFRLDNYIVYNDVVELLTEELIDKTPFRFEVRNTFRASGIVVEEYVLDFVYDWLRVNVNITGLCARSGLEIVNRPDDWETVGAVPTEAFHNHGDLHVVKKHDC